METRMLGGLLRAALLLSPIVIWTPGLRAQEGTGQHGMFEVGVRGIVGDRASSKFNEYRHIENGLFIPQFDTTLDGLFGGKYFLEAQNRKFLERDQAIRVAFGRYGKFRMEMRWNETPHVFTNTAVTPFMESAPGAFSMPTPTRTALQGAPAMLPQIVTGLQPADLSLGRKLGSGLLTFTPKAAWTVQLQYSRESVLGHRPLGTTTDGFSNMVELPEPIDYRNNQAKALIEYAGARGGFQASYGISRFTNEVSQIVWDNPFRATDAVNGSSHGRLALYPDNSLQSLGFAGAVNLTPKTRLMASISPEWMTQNQPFLPFTINTAITGVSQLPASNLNGSKQTLAMNYTLTNRPIERLELTARYRSYDYNNNTPSLVFANYVTADGSLSTLTRQSLPYGYNRHNVGLEAVWEFLPKQSVKAGYEFEQFDRQHRDVATSLENSGFASVDLNPKKWLLLRTTYRHSQREPRRYEANEEINPLGEGPFGMGQLEDFRKFDEAARTRDQSDVLLQVDPGGRFSFSATYATVQDRYHDSPYGLLRYKNNSAGVDLTYQLRHEVSLIANYALERYRSDQRSRQRNPPSPTAAANDSPNNDWESYLGDLIHTWGAGISGNALHGKLRIDTFYNLSLAKGTIATRALGNPALPGFLVTTAQDYPETSNRFHQVTAGIRYALSNTLAPKLEYRYERYGRADFQISPMVPYMVGLDPSTNTSVFLGADVPGYHVHILQFSLEYRY